MATFFFAAMSKNTLIPVSPRSGFRHEKRMRGSELGPSDDMAATAGKDFIGDPGKSAPVHIAASNFATRATDIADAAVTGVPFSTMQMPNSVAR